MAEKLNPFYKLLKSEVPINITSELKDNFGPINKALNDVCQLAMKQAIPGKQLVLMTDARFRSAGFALMIEDNPDQKIQSKKKIFAPVAFGSEIFSLHNSRCQFTRKNFCKCLWHFLSLHTSREKHQNRRLFQRTINPPPIFSRLKPFHHPSGTHAIMCCSSTLK